MAKKKNTEKSAVEEIDLSAIDIDSLMISELGEDLSFLKFPTEEEKPAKKVAKKTTKTTEVDLEAAADEFLRQSSEKLAKKSKKSDDENDFVIKSKDSDNDFEDEFAEFKDDFDDDFDFDPDESELAEIEKDNYKAPKDFFTDKRRQKNLKKFLDVEVPAEFLEGLDENMQLLFKKGKAEGKLVYDEVMSALPIGDDIEFMDEVFSRLAKLGIELVDSLDQNDLFKDADKKVEEIDLADISDDSVRMYLNEIGRFKLIDGDEETRLGRLIQKGDQDARKRLAEANLRLVVSIAKKYMGR